MGSRNKKGSSNYEFLIIAIICLVLTILLILVTLKGDDTEKMQIFRYHAKEVSLNAVFAENTDTVYLQEMVTDGLISPLKNPFGGSELCDMNESKVQIINGQKLVTLRCGNYLIYRQRLGDKEYPIYRVSRWTTRKNASTTDEIVFYNLKIENKKIFEEEYEEALFLKKVNQYLGTAYTKINEIDGKYKVLSRRMYREKIKINH